MSVGSSATPPLTSASRRPAGPRVTPASARPRRARCPARSARLLHPLEPGAAERGGGRLGLALPHLHQQGAARLEVGRRLGRQPRDRLQARGPGHEGLGRLEAQLRRRRLQLGRREVGRVGGDEGEAPTGEGAEAVRVQPLHLQAEPPPVRPRHGEGGPGALDRRHAQAVPLVGQRQGHRAAPRPPVEHGGARRRDLEGPLHQHLGLGARHQHLRADLQPQAPERPRAGDVGERLAPAAPGDQRAGAVELGGGQGPLGGRVEREPLDAQGVGEQQVGVEPGRGRPAHGQERRAAPQHLGHRQKLGRPGQLRALARMNEVSGPSRKPCTASLTSRRLDASASASSCVCTSRM